MSHCAIVKRKKSCLTVQWYDRKVIYDLDYLHRFYTINNRVEGLKVIDYEHTESIWGGISFKNVIAEEIVIGDEFVFWEGEIKLLPLKEKETLVINNEKFNINRVEKDVNGIVTYYVGELTTKDENYNKLLLKYEDRLGEIIESKKSSEVIYESPEPVNYENNNEIIVEHTDSQIPWWKRIFS